MFNKNNNKMDSKRIIFFFSFLLLVSCTETQQPNQPNNSNYTKPSAFILCEGLYNYNNATLTRYDISTNKSDNDFIGNNNPGYQLGDIANDELIKGDSLFVLVSSSKVLYLINANTGRILKYISFEGDRYPRRLAIANDSIIYFSDAYDNSINEVNLNQSKITNSIKVGPQPEGLFVYRNKIYLVNSGWGDLNKANPEAGTLWIINLNSKNVEKKIYVGPNPVEIIPDSSNNRYFITYYNFPSEPDSLGGILEYDLQTNAKLKQWRGNFTNVLSDESHNSLFAIVKDFSNDSTTFCSGIAKINLNDNTMKQIIKNNIPQNIWYSLAFDKARNYIWIGNAKNFQVNGEVLIYNFNNIELPIKSIETGINPNKIIFYN
jgi:hypothetical protein